MFNLFKTRQNNVASLSVIPSHIAFIMDGNRRWAKRRGQPAIFGHRKGANIIEGVARYLFDRGVSTLSLYAWSMENWSRSKAEVDALMDLIVKELPKYIKNAKKENIRLRFIGRRDRLSKEIVRIFNMAEKETAENTRGTIVFAVDYGGHDEIIRAANMAIAEGRPVDVETFESFMDTGDLLPIDLMVRTSGEQRISNFMLWKLAYAEMMFVGEDWPDMDEKILHRILVDFAGRTRRFGK